MSCKLSKYLKEFIYNQTLCLFIIFLSKHQSGFHALHSTVTALLEAIDSWAYNIDIGNVKLLFFLTLRKRLTQSIIISYCLNYIFMVYQVLPMSSLPSI